MPDRRFSIPIDGSGVVSAIRSEAKKAAWTFAYAPGAGSNLDDPFGAFAARSLPAEGVNVVRFQFPYMESGRKGPDRPAVLEATWRAVIDEIRDGGTKLVAGGRSMGGRIASMAVADGAPADAVALFAYPLHPPGKPEQQRVEHLPRIKAPVLFCSGTNDAFASQGELNAAVKKVRWPTVHVIEGADHGFAVRRSSGRTREDVWREAIGAMLQWLRALR